jgi:hypothetical protein
MAQLARVFALDSPFRPSLMLMGEAGAYPIVEHLKGVSLRVGSGLTIKH